MDVELNPATRLRNRSHSQLAQVPRVHDAMHDVYLPFSPYQIRQHFLDNSEGHISYFQDRINHYHIGFQSHYSRSVLKKHMILEKDVRIWTTSTLMSFFHHPHRTELLSEVFHSAFGERPTLSGLSSWEECLSGDLQLLFEVKVASPSVYLKWIRENLEENQPLPHQWMYAKRIDGSSYRNCLEGFCFINAVLVNKSNGFNVLFMPQIIDDITYSAENDTYRNQLIRTLDVMLDEEVQNNPTNTIRQGNRSLFMLVSLERFKQRYETRLYGHLFHLYKSDPSSLIQALPHRDLTMPQAAQLSAQMGWITWENLADILPCSCRWVRKPRV